MTLSIIKTDNFKMLHNIKWDIRFEWSTENGQIGKQVIYLKIKINHLNENVKKVSRYLYITIDLVKKKVSFENKGFNSLNYKLL